jgi:DNA-binding MarR family transcriptional regulator
VSEREQSAYVLAKLIKRARRQIGNAIRERLDPIGTSLHTVQIIRRVTEDGEVNQLELARQIELEPGALCRRVTELEAEGLVERRRDPDDHRRVLVAATPAGAALLARAHPKAMAGLEAMVSRLSQKEQGTLRRLLEKLAPEDDLSPDSSPDRA